MAVQFVNAVTTVPPSQHQHQRDADARCSRNGARYALTACAGRTMRNHRRSIQLMKRRLRRARSDAPEEAPLRVRSGWLVWPILGLHAVDLLETFWVRGTARELNAVRRDAYLVAELGPLVLTLRLRGLLKVALHHILEGVIVAGCDARIAHDQGADTAESIRCLRAGERSMSRTSQPANLRPAPPRGGRATGGKGGAG